MDASIPEFRSGLSAHRSGATLHVVELRLEDF
jgi:hypothetical protein